MEEDVPYNAIGTRGVGVLVVAAIVIFLIWLLWLNQITGVVRTTLLPPEAAASTPATNVLEQLGQAGDAFGSLNALFAGLAAALVAAAAYLQNEQLKEARKAYEEERDARRQQQFEATFFRLLDLSRELIGRIAPIYVVADFYDGSTEKEKENGAAALESIAAAIHKAAGAYFADDATKRASFLVTLYRKRVFGKQPSTFGPYWRVLFQMFKLIDESGLDPEKQIRYANIARGQLSEGAVLLLALNGLSHRGYKFIRYIEKFGLLEHMHYDYKRPYEESLLVGYRKRAFLGSTERKEHEFIPTPLEPVETFDPPKEVLQRANTLEY